MERGAPGHYGRNRDASISASAWGGCGRLGLAKRLPSGARGLWRDLHSGDPALKGRRAGTTEAPRICWGPLLLTWAFSAVRRANLCGYEVC